MRAAAVCLLLFWGLSLHPQVYHLQNAAALPESLQPEVKSLFGRQDSISTAALLVKTLKEILYKQGYYLAEIRSRPSQDSLILQIYPGPPLYQKRFRLQGNENILIPPPRQALYKPLNFNQESEYYLSYLENHGYPFAQLQLESYSLSRDTLRGLWQIDPGPLRRFDSLVIKGFDRFSASVLKHDLGFRPGMLYSEDYLESLPERIAAVEYLESKRVPAVAFTLSKSVLYLYLEERKSNQIDGVLGLNTNQEGVVSLNGDFQLRLLHAFKKGEEIKLRWRRPDESVQALDLLLEIPYLFRSPLWWRNEVEIFKQDSSFVNYALHTKLKYLLSSRNFLSGAIEFKGSSALTGAEVQAGLDSYEAIFYRLGIDLGRSDRLLLPRKGYQLQLAVGRGAREANGNSISQFDYRLQSATFFNPWSRHIFKLGLSSQALFSPSYLSNEIYRIGGLKSLRGFNEQSIYSSAYGIATFEYRFAIGNYDYLGIFSDIAYSENRVEEFSHNWLSGLGTGINFETGGGIFSLFFAVGKDNNSSFDLRSTKVHFGYVNQF